MNQMYKRVYKRLVGKDCWGKEEKTAIEDVLGSILYGLCMDIENCPNGDFYKGFIEGKINGLAHVLYKLDRERDNDIKAGQYVNIIKDAIEQELCR